MLRVATRNSRLAGGGSLGCSCLLTPRPSCGIDCSFLPIAITTTTTTTAIVAVGSGMTSAPLLFSRAFQSSSSLSSSFASVRATGGAYGDNRTRLDAVEATIPRMRNIGIVAHIDAGKTTTTERMLFYAGATKRIGDVDSGTTTTDFMKEEMDRGITIQSAAVSLQWGDTPIHLIDTPGHVDFTVEVERALRVVDGVVALFDASAGVQAQSYTVLQQSRKFQVPTLAFLNKMDKYNADYKMCVASIRDKLQVEPLLLQLPLQGEDGSFEGVVDLVEFRFCRFGGDRGSDMAVRDLNAADGGGEGAHVLASARRARHELIGQLTGLDDGLSEKLIEALDSTDGDEEAAEALLRAEDVRRAIRRLTLAVAATTSSSNNTSGLHGRRSRPVMPVLCGASRRDMGVQPLLDAVRYYLPSPKDRSLTGLTQAGMPTPLPPASASPMVPTVALAFKVTHALGPKGDRQPLVFIRVYSGRVTPRMSLRNNTRGKAELIDKLYVMHANTPVEVPYLCAGEIGAAFLPHTYTGDTLFAPPQQHVLHAKAQLRLTDETEEVFSLEGIDAPPPVISFSIEAATKGQITLLSDALAELSREDPSLRVASNNFGNVVVSGMGELHLDIVMSRLEHEYQARCRLLRAIIEYREAIRQPQRLERRTVAHNDLPYMECSIDLRQMLPEESNDGGSGGGGGGCDRWGPNASCIFSIDPAFEELYLSSQRGAAAATSTQSQAARQARLEDVRNAKEDLRAIRACFQKAVVDCARLGPLAGLPMHGCEFVLTHLRRVGGQGQLQEKVLMLAARTAVLELVKSIPKADLAILEPMMEVEVHLSESSYIGNVVSSLNEHKAVTVDVQEDGRSVKATVAMRNVVRYTTELRKAVKGHANYFTKLQYYAIVEDKAVIARILKNLGIAE